MALSSRCQLAFLFAFVLQIHSSISNLSFTGSTVELGGVPYYVPGKAFAMLSTGVYHRIAGHRKYSGYGWIPVTVIGEQDASSSSLESISALFEKSDDVWTTSFLSGIILVGKKSSPHASKVLSGANSTTVVATLDHGYSSKIPVGPYLISPVGEIYQPWRLYTDTQGAFTQPIIPAVGGSFAALPATVPGIASPGVAVPSRLYYTKTSNKPLAGVRTGIKDIYDIAGVKTSDGNRAYYGLYPPRNETALVVQRLIDAGAIIIGKMKTSQFANGELATADWVDYHEPFNPRGDGYQDTSSSSSGPGSGAGSYPWLDLTVGSDTGGSIRGPSQVQGLYGNRPTHGLVELTNTMPLAPQLDTGGFLCRDPVLWTAAAKVLYEGLPFPSGYPKKLQTIGFPTSDTSDDPLTSASNAVLLKFLSKLEAFLGSKATALNYTELWAKTKPDLSLPPLPVLLNTTYATLISKEQTRLVRAPFYKDYAAIHDGRLPFVDPAPLARWAFGDSLPASALEDAINNKTIFKDWWEAHVLEPADSDTTCSGGFVLYSSGASVAYRNEYLDPPTPPLGFSTARFSVFGEGPDFVIPIGSAEYASTITNHTEELPVTVDVLAGRGCDAVIFNLARALLKAGIVAVSKTGQTIEKGGEILLKE